MQVSELRSRAPRPKCLPAIRGHWRAARGLPEVQICLELRLRQCLRAASIHGAARPLQRPNHKRHCVRTAADVAAAVQVAARTTPVDILVEARSMVEEDNLRSICGPRDLGEFQVGTPRKRPT